MKDHSWVWSALAVVVSLGLGLVAAALDVAAPFGDDSEKFTILVWLTFSGLLGFAWPRHPWRWAVLIGPCVPITYLVFHALGRRGFIQPDVPTTSLILFPVSIGVCLLGAFGGAWLRRSALPPSPAAQ